MQVATNSLKLGGFWRAGSVQVWWEAWAYGVCVGVRAGVGGGRVRARQEVISPFGRHYGKDQGLRTLKPPQIPDSRRTHSCPREPSGPVLCCS